jgi:hypothetical protein
MGAIALAKPFWDYRGKKWHLAGPFRREQIGRFDARLIVQSATEKYGRVDTIWTW